MKYEFASAPGILNSTLRLYPFPQIRKGLVLLSTDQLFRLVGAQEN